MTNEKRIAGWVGKPLEKMIFQTRTILERLPTRMITQEHFEDIKTDVYYIVKDMPRYLDTIEAQVAELADTRENAAKWQQIEDVFGPDDGIHDPGDLTPAAVIKAVDRGLAAPKPAESEK